MAVFDPFRKGESESDLRERGLYPYSRLSVRCGAIVGVLICLYLSFSMVHENLLAILSLPRSPDMSYFDAVRLALDVFPVFLWLAASGLIGAVVIGMSQSQGRFDWGVIAPDPSRLSPFRLPPLSRVASALLRVAFIGAVGGPIILLGSYLTFVLGRWILAADSIQALLLLRDVGRYSLPLLALALMGVAIVSWIIRRQRFRWRYMRGDS